jgi:hypothetical protein
LGSRSLTAPKKFCQTRSRRQDRRHRWGDLFDTAPVSPHTTILLLRFLKLGGEFVQIVDYIGFIGIRKFCILDGITGFFEFLFDVILQP